jgi:protein TonB
MFADRQQNAQAPGALSRSGPAIAVIGIHVILIYLISASMGIVPIPSVIESSEVILIPEATEEIQPEPIKEPEIEPPAQMTESVPIEVPMVPVIEEDVPVAPVDTTPITAVAVQTPPAAGAPAQQLQAKQRVEPTYPAEARRNGEEGTVRLKVLVDERGRPSDVQIAQGSGFSRLDQAAIEAVRRWRFQAATDGSRAISAWTQVAISFKLTDAQRR